MVENNKKDNPKTVDELLKDIDKNMEESLKHLSAASDEITDALINGNTPKQVPIKKGVLDRLIKGRGKKMVALLATLGVVALGYSLKTNQKESNESKAPSIQQQVPPHTTQDKTLNVLDALIKDPHAFDGIEIKDSMESDCIMMNTKVLDVLEEAIKKAGYVDENGNLKPMKMLDISNADALDSLKSGLQAPGIYKGKKLDAERR